MPNLIDIWESFDRPCDTCKGRKKVEGMNHGPGDLLFPCPDCGGTGRHTFTIEVEERWTAYSESDTGVRTLRVSVVPGMVLRIRCNESDFDSPDHSGDVFVCADGTAYVDTAAAYMDDITMPPAARPGMWAVQLRIDGGAS